ncbi:GNAT family N-acetyltransferase [Rhodococcus sp. P1Y]|uniref:GNAT family N-acetyltransferase n=1 Tax=Rhodococcus sp. P1Y TaxID=1302308 RepID=UPI000EAFA8E1|nr:GNAT family N-acetyltransferase [Rhodococcus sp. P1Y]AYJ48174.1 N-acetyltransferase [Rhodococcus sp. P1Y]
MINYQEAEVAELRTLFGATTVPWAGHSFDSHEAGWAALSGADQPDYNLALVHGDNADRHVQSTIDTIDASGRPAIVMLAGRGLAGGQILADAGWVCIGAMPFMARENPGGLLDPDIRELTETDLGRARELAGAAFGVGSLAAGRLFTPELLDHPDTTIAGLFVEDELVCCGLMCRAPGASTGWALATAARHRGSGYARRLISGNLEIDFARRGPSTNLCLATPRGRRLYEDIGFQTVEYWQTWSKPRWFLGVG